MPKAAGFPPASKILQKYEKDRAQKLHRQKVSNMKAKLNNSPPKAYPHLVLRTKKLQQDEAEQARIEHDNRLLLDKMSYIMRHQGRVDNWNDYEQRSLNNPYRERQLENIAAENVDIAKRLEKIQPQYDVQEWEDDFQRHEYYLELWAESSKDYQASTPRGKNKEKESRQDKYEDDFDSDHGDDSQQQRTEGDDADSVGSQKSYHDDGQEQKKLPKIDNKQREKNKSRSDSKVTKLPKIENGSKQDDSPEGDAKLLFKVCKQMVKEEDQAIIKALAKKPYSQRMQTKAKFREMYDLDLEPELKTGLGRDWDVLIEALLAERESSDADALHDALEGNNISAAVEILCTRNNSALASIKEAYQKEYSISLESDISDKTDDPIQILLLTLQKGNRVETTDVNEKAAQKDAEALYEFGDGRWTSESGKFIKLLNEQSLPHVRSTLNLYKQVSGGKDVHEAVKDECDKDYANALKTLINCVSGPHVFYADKLYKNMSGTDPAFVNTLVTRSEMDLPNIKKTYKKKYDADLVTDMKERIDHPTKRVLIELANKVPPQGKGKNKKLAGMSIVGPPKKQPMKKPGQKDKKGDSDDKTNNSPFAKPSRTKTKVHEKNESLEDDVERLRKAMKGLGTDEDVIIEILTQRSNQQRQEIQNKYNEKYKRDLTDDLKSELSGDFEEVIVGLMKTPVEYDSFCLHEAMDGVGTSEATLIGILCTRNSQDLKKIQEQYKKDYNAELDADVKGDTSGGFQDLLLSIMKGERDAGSSVNQEEAKEDAKVLYQNEKAEITADNETFQNLMTKKNSAQIKATSEEYEKLSGSTLQQAITKGMSGDDEDAYMGLVNALDDPIEFYASRLHGAFSGLGTNDNMLIRIVISHAETDLPDIKAKYKELYGKTLSESIKSECSGDYKKALLVIVGDNNDGKKKKQSNTKGSEQGTKNATKGTDNTKGTKTNNKDDSSQQQTRKGTNVSQEKREDTKTKKETKESKPVAAKNDRGTRNDENDRGTSKDVKHDKSDDRDTTKGSTNKSSKTKSPERRKGSPTDGKGSMKGTKGGSKDKDSETKGDSKADDDDYDAGGDVVQLYNAMDGFGTDETLIIEIITSRNTKKRQKLKAEYQKKYNKDLVTELKGELSGNFEDAVILLMADEVERDVTGFHDAMSGLGTDETQLITMLVTKTTEEINTIEDRYKEMYNKTLSESIKSETSGDFQTILLLLIEGPREGSDDVDDDEVSADVKKLIEITDKPKEEITTIFIDVIVRKDRPHLKEVCVRYKQETEKDIVDTLEESLKGDVERALVLLVKYTRDPVLFYADILNSAMKGMGTNDSLLMYIIVSQSEKDLGPVKSKYKEVYQKSLSDAVSSECSGDYKKILLALLKDK